MDDPDRQYTDAVKSALIDAMLDHSLSMDLGPDEWLTVAARQSDGPLANNQLYDVATIVLRVKGSDLGRLRRRSHQARRRPAEGRRQGLLIYNSRDDGPRATASSLLALLLVSLAGVAGCGPPIDIKQAVQITDIYRRLVRRRDQGRQEQAHAERHVPGQEVDRRSHPAAGAEPRLQEDHAERRGRLRRLLRPDRDFGDGNESAPLTVRTETGYTADPPQSRAEMLQHKEFQDLRVVFFAKHSSSNWVELGALRHSTHELLTR